MTNRSLTDVAAQARRTAEDMGGRFGAVSEPFEASTALCTDDPRTPPPI